LRQLSEQLAEAQAEAAASRQPEQRLVSVIAQHDKASAELTTGLLAPRQLDCSLVASSCS